MKKKGHIGDVLTIIVKSSLLTDSTSEADSRMPLRGGPLEKSGKFIPFQSVVVVETTQLNPSLRHQISPEFSSPTSLPSIWNLVASATGSFFSSVTGEAFQLGGTCDETGGDEGGGPDGHLNVKLLP